jgi:hypothetical protein
MRSRVNWIVAVSVCAASLASVSSLAGDNAKSHQPKRAPQPASSQTYTAVAPKQPNTSSQHGIIFVGGKSTTSNNGAINSQPVPPGKNAPFTGNGAINSQPVPPGKNPPINTRSSLNPQPTTPGRLRP